MVYLFFAESVEHSEQVSEALVDGEEEERADNVLIEKERDLQKENIGSHVYTRLRRRGKNSRKSKNCPSVL